MEILYIISEHKKIRKTAPDGRPNTPVKPGMKRVEAVLKYKGQLYTRHVDIKK